VDDVPAVSVTLNTNDFGDVKTLATLAQVIPAKVEMAITAVDGNANLVSDPTGTANYLHGVSLADFAVTCGNLPGVTLWAPVQEECSIGTLSNNIDQTLFLDELFVNSLEFSYSTGANATENYGAETDNKMWLLNDGRFVNYEEFTLLSAGALTDGFVMMTLGAGNDVATLTTGLGFLRKSDSGAPAVTWFDESKNEMINVEVVTGSAAAATTYVYDNTTMPAQHKLYLPTGTNAPADGDRLQLIYSADAYTPTTNNYFVELEEPTERPDSVGALRQGQVEVYIVDPDSSATAFANAWRLTSANISVDLTREPLTELGHLGPYDRPLTMPIPITLTVDTTAGDLENWAKFAGKLDDLDTMGDIKLSDLMIKDNLILVVKVYEQTDEEAGGTSTDRKVVSGSALDGEDYFLDGVLDTYAAGDTERALKTVVVKNLKITDEGMSLDVGSNATQTFGFRTTNDLYVIKGDINYATAKARLARNA